MGLMEVTCGDYPTHACRANHRCVLRGPNCVSPENEMMCGPSKHGLGSVAIRDTPQPAAKLTSRFLV